MSKPRRRVTVDADKSVSDDIEKQKPSVFERLGPGGVRPRKYADSTERPPTCRYWRINGSCHFGSKCKFTHPQYSQREDRSPEDSRRHRQNSRSGSSSRSRSGSRSGSRSPVTRPVEKLQRHDKMKSAVVVRKSKLIEPEEDSEDSGSWNLDKLDYKKELELEKKRQQLQRELSQLAGSEDEQDNIKIQKKVGKHHSGSESESSERTKVSKKVSKISPFKMKLDKKNKLKPSPIVMASTASKAVRAQSPEKPKMALKLKDTRKKPPGGSDDEDSPRAKLKKAKKMAKQIMAVKQAEVESPVKKKKHSPRVEKRVERVRVSRFSDAISPMSKKTKSKSPGMRSRSSSSSSPVKRKGGSPKGKDKSKSKKKKMESQPPVSFNRRSFSPERKSRSHSKGGRGKREGKKKYESSSSSDSSSSSSSSPEVRRKKRVPRKSKERDRRDDASQKRDKKSRKKRSSESPPPVKSRGSPPRPSRRQVPSPDRRRKEEEVVRRGYDRGGSPDSLRSASSSPGRDRRGRNQSPDERHRRDRERDEMAKKRPDRDRSPDERRPDRRDDVRRPDPREEVRRQDGRDDPRRPDPREDVRRPDGRNDMRRPEGRDEIRRPEGRDDMRRRDDGREVREDVRRDDREDFRQRGMDKEELEIRREIREEIRREEAREDPRRVERDDLRRDRDELRRPDEFIRGGIRGNLREEIRRPEFDPRRSPHRSISPDMRRDRERPGRPVDFRPAPGERGRYEAFPDRFEPDRRMERDIYGPRDRGRLDPPFDRERDPLERFPLERPIRDDLRRSPPFDRPGFRETTWDRGRGRGWNSRGRGRGLDVPPRRGYEPPSAGPYGRGRYSEREFSRVGGRREWDDWDARRDERLDVPRDRFDDRMLRDDGRPTREPWPPRDDRRPDFRDERRLEERLGRRDESLERREQDISPYRRRPEGRDERIREPSFDHGSRDDRGRDPKDFRERLEGRDSSRDRGVRDEERRMGPRDDRGRRERREDDTKSEKSMDSQREPGLSEDDKPPKEKLERENREDDRISRSIERPRESRPREDGSPRSDRGRKAESHHSDGRGSHHERESRRSERAPSNEDVKNKEEKSFKDKDSKDGSVSRKRNNDADDKNSTGSSPAHKRHRDVSPARSSRSLGSAGGRSQSSRSRFRSRGEELKREEGRSRSGSHEGRRRHDPDDKDKANRSADDRGRSKRSRSLSKDRSEKDVKRHKAVDDKPSKAEEDSLTFEALPDCEGQFSPDHKSDRSFAADSPPEQVKEVFSDWSDDDEANEILIQEPAIKNIKDAERRRRSLSRSSRGSRGSRSSRHDDKKSEKDKAEKPSEGLLGDRPKVEPAGPVVQPDSTVSDDITKKDLDGIDDEAIDYDSISSDEGSFLDEDGENKKKEKQSIVDVLDIDWASLQTDTRPKPATGSALNRFKPHNLFREIGVSRQYAGEKLYQRIIDECQKNLDLETKENEENGSTDNKVKEVEKPKFKFEHDVASIHCLALDKIRERANLFKNMGPFRRALCARRDLEIRRVLCKVDMSLEVNPVIAANVVDPQVQKLGIQLYKQHREKMDNPDCVDAKS